MPRHTCQKSEGGHTLSKRWLRSASLVIAGVFLAAACSAGGSGGGKGEIIIASDFPVSGADRASGRPAEAGVAYAVSLNTTVKGFTITHKPYDDAVNGVHDPQKGAQNVTDMCNNTKVLGMVGPFNSNVARAVIPVGNKCNLVEISPSNTNECLTQTFDYCDPKPAALRDPSQPNNYFRIAAPDTVQGPAMADFAFDTLKITKIAVWSDNETFGKGVADNFAKEFQKKGGTVVVRQDFDTKTTSDFKPFLQRAKDAGAGGIYAGATSATKGCIPRAQSKGILDVPYMGPDGIGDTQCIKDAGDQATDKMYFTNAAAEAAQDSANNDLIANFKKAFTQKDDIGAYTFPAYDCAKILIDAIGRAIDAAGGNMPTRKQVIDAVQGTNKLKLSTGVYSFDKNGDPTSATMAFYQYKGTDWAFVKQFSVGQ
jgi:branched-chain amino acid transport system substrate-binding protein